MWRFYVCGKICSAKKSFNFEKLLFILHAVNCDSMRCVDDDRLTSFHDDLSEHLVSLMTTPRPLQ